MNLRNFVITVDSDDEAQQTLHADFCPLVPAIPHRTIVAADWIRAKELSPNRNLKVHVCSTTKRIVQL